MNLGEFYRESRIDCGNACSAASVAEPLLDEQQLLSVEDELSVGAAPPW